MASSLAALLAKADVATITDEHLIDARTQLRERGAHSLRVPEVASAITRVATVSPSASTRLEALKALNNLLFGAADGDVAGLAGEDVQRGVLSLLESSADIETEGFLIRVCRILIYIGTANAAACRTMAVTWGGLDAIVARLRGLQIDQPGFLAAAPSRTEDVQYLMRVLFVFAYRLEGDLHLLAARAAAGPVSSGAAASGAASQGAPDDGGASAGAGASGEDQAEEGGEESKRAAGGASGGAAGGAAGGAVAPTGATPTPSSSAAAGTATSSSMEAVGLATRDLLRNATRPDEPLSASEAAVLMDVTKVLTLAPPSFLSFLAQEAAIPSVLVKLLVRCVEEAAAAQADESKGALVDTEKANAVAAVVPVTMVANSMITASAAAFDVFMAAIFPTPIEDVPPPPVEGVGPDGRPQQSAHPTDAPEGTFRHVLLRLMISLNTDVKRVVSELIWTLCKEDAQIFTRRVGVGYGIHLMQIKAGNPIG